MLPENLLRGHFSWRDVLFLSERQRALPRPVSISMLAFQILIDGFAISALYALGATGFTLIFGVSGVLNLSHGAIMVLAAVAAWAAASVLHLDTYCGALVGVAVALVSALITYFAVVQPIQRSRRIPNEEKEIFVLTGTLLWGIMIQELIAYFFTNNAKTVLPIVEGVVDILGVRTPRNEIFTAFVCCLVIALLWLLVNRTRTGKAVLAASMNPRGVTLLGLELSNIYVVVWAIYGTLAGIAGVLLGMFLGVSSYSVGPLTASAFSIVVLGGLGSVSGSLIAAFVVGYLETLTAYLVSPAYRTIPALLLLVAVMYVRPQGLLGRR
jgi:branched-chain amino acid transport system permease protein